MFEHFRFSVGRGKRAKIPDPYRDWQKVSRGRGGREEAARRPQGGHEGEEGFLESEVRQKAKP